MSSVDNPTRGNRQGQVFLKLTTLREISQTLEVICVELTKRLEPVLRDEPIELKATPEDFKLVPLAAELSSINKSIEASVDTLRTVLDKLEL